MLESSESPSPGHASAGTFFVDGYLIASSPGTIRLLCGKICLVLSTEGLLSIEEIDEPLVGDAVRARPVRLGFARNTGTRLIDVINASLFADELGFGRRPFAVVAREAIPQSCASPDYSIRERDFLKELGIGRE